MAVVGKEELWINNKKYVFTIRVLRDGLFRTEIPMELKNYASDYRSRYNSRRDARVLEYECETKDELLDRLNALAKNVKESSTTKRKVILYDIKIDCTVEGPPELRDDYDPERFKGYDKVVILGPERSWDHRGMSIDISAAVFIESQVSQLDGSTKYSYDSADVPRDERLPDGLHSSHLGGTWNAKEPAKNLLDWTQERHDFFVRIYEAMGQLAWQLHNLAKPGNIDKAIESGMKFLENKGKPEDPDD
jgi:hypothetical protein